MSLSWNILLCIIIALTIHEASHALVAYWLGDPTAKNQGRISLNPLKHLDLVGSILFLLIGIGWGKPVIINPHYFTHPKRDQALVALAGPASNFILAFLSTILLTYTNFSPFFLNNLIDINILLCAFNLLPFPPLDGSKILSLFIPHTHYYRYEQFLQTNLSYIIVFVLIDMMFLSKLIGFSIIFTILNIIITFLKAIIAFGV